VNGDDEQGTLDRRGWEIAANARRYRLLSRRPEFLSHSRVVRADHALSDESLPVLDLFDAVMAIGTSELDRFCGYAVALLNNPKRRSGPLLDAIGILDPDRVAAIFFALDPSRRKVMRDDPACAYHVQQVEQDYAESEEALEEMIAETGGTTVGYDLARVAFGFEKDGSAGDDR
jgi:hypothetical protein